MEACIETNRCLQYWHMPNGNQSSHIKFPPCKENFGGSCQKVWRPVVAFPMVVVLMAVSSSMRHQLLTLTSSLHVTFWGFLDWS
ncbi:hypothetical protein CEXT_500141 [Caerostris extrusa]|uniref:Uncharacterized protein n=1 Tax=Caerostris extrusa TaxID=172846 RepID=A0AAV4NCJ3_CAEEX|nr:hypothetical protein CEXT_500141 [Caerostris extrusa]